MKQDQTNQKAGAGDAVCDRAREIYVDAELQAQRGGLMPHEMAMGLAFLCAELENRLGPHS